MNNKKNGQVKNPTQLDTFVNVIDIFRNIDSEFPIQYMLCLAEIARTEGVSLTELAERTQMSLSTVSRVVGALSNYRSNNQPYKLVSMQVSKTERRRKELSLTAKGHSLINKLNKVLYNSSEK
ncbi:MAG: MarR family transcriptional regulator [Alphaproteobacteria bacterium]|nr:MarR family transcriptional regulator [Alphaproteobacteria bacterium]|tara:strand:- start:461 stop:829 length:369 start_codon:yes stop_codon:yes gene_type:complete